MPALFSAATCASCNQQSDEVYDEGREFTLIEYKNMADSFSKKWAKRDPPQELKRRLPRRVKTEVWCTPALAPVTVPAMLGE